MADKQIIVTVEQEGKKAIITLTPDGNGGMNCKAEWQPAMDKEKSTEERFACYSDFANVKGVTMADKEERIWLEFDIPKPKGAIEATRCTTMTRQEAIEKIAKALFLKTNKGDNWADYKKIYPKNGYIDDAEAALNSLLEDKK